MIPLSKAPEYLINHEESDENFGPRPKYSVPESTDCNSWPIKLESDFQYFVGI